MNNLQKLKEIIQAANPEILELKFGCEVLIHDMLGENQVVVDVMPENNINIFYKYPNSPKTFHFYVSEKELRKPYNKILGRPITLADVLLAIGNKYSIQGSGHFMWYGSADFGESIDWNEVWEDGQRKVWDLTKDLDHQSTECIDFLSKVLGV